MQFGRTPSELEETLLYSEFVELLALYSIEPYGEDAAWIRHGINTAVLRNCHAKNAAKPIDFMPYHKPPDPESFVKEPLDEVSKAAMKAFSGFPVEIKKRKKKRGD